MVRGAGGRSGGRRVAVRLRSTPGTGGPCWYHQSWYHKRKVAGRGPGHQPMSCIR